MHRRSARHGFSLGAVGVVLLVLGLMASSASASPTVTTCSGSPVAPITPNGATFHGTINPGGVAGTMYHFEWGRDSTYGHVTPDEDPGSGSADVPATATVVGLMPNTTYHHRLVDTNDDGTINGDDCVFVTPPAPPLLDATAPFATKIAPTGATLNGKVDAQGSDTAYHFDYGLTDAYGSATPDAGPLSGQGSQAAVANVAGLTPSTAYHFRVSADNGTGGVQTGVDQTFTTAPAAPAGASSVAAETAGLTGTVNPHGRATTFHFEYGIDLTYDRRTIEDDAGSAGGETTVTGRATLLLPDTTYHVRVIATDVATGGTTIGVDGTFTTSSPAAPLATPEVVTAAPVSPYGCAAPILAAYDQHPKPGDKITVSGSDLGVGGTVLLGGNSLTPTAWSATGVTVTLPEDAKGTLPLTVNCWNVSNTIAIAMFQAPPSTFSATGKAKGSTATVRVKVPGPGSISIKSAHTKAATKHAGGAATYSVKATLTAKAAKALKKHHRLAVSLTVRYAPNGGRSATKTLKVTFRR
jgi:hypothetical protein